jgi:hypothetical protein
MPAIDIPCPECGRLLKIPDRSMLGRKARCGKCQHKFILQERTVAPAAPRTQLANAQSSRAQAPAAPMQFESSDGDEDDNDRTMMGVAARFITPELRAALQAPVAAPVAPQVAAPRPAPPVVEAPFAPDALALSTAEADAEVDNVARVRERKQAAKRRQQIVMGASAAGIVVVALALYAGFSGKGSARPGKKGPAHVAKAVADEETDDDSGDAENTEKSTRVEPILLSPVPEGARIVINLRPADLWQAGGTAEEFRACLGPVGVWLEQVIKTQCILEPSKIEELLFALIPISRDSFDFAFVVHANSDLKKSELIDKIDGELIDEPRQHYVGPERAWMIVDSRTFASAPKSMVDSFVQSAGGSAVTSEGIQALLAKTDRKKHLTLLCELEDVRLGTGTLVPANVQHLLEGIVDFFGDDVETVAWSLNLGEASSATKLTSELYVRNRLSRSPPKLEADLKKKLAALPAQVLELVYKTDPKKIGEKKIVGRYPMMTKIVEQKTHFSNSHRLVSMNIELPERAGPNLALGTLFTWNQTTLPDFGKSSSAPSSPGDGQKLPDKIADRLKKKITVDFRNDFLYAAINFISDETGVTIKLDGPGMKMVGVTQNERQQFAMEDAPATAVLAKILNAKKLVLIVDEENNVATVTSNFTADEKKLKPFPLEAAGK